MDAASVFSVWVSGASSNPATRTHLGSLDLFLLFRRLAAAKEFGEKALALGFGLLDLFLVVSSVTSGANLGSDLLLLFLCLVVLLDFGRFGLIDCLDSRRVSGGLLGFGGFGDFRSRGFGAIDLGGGLGVSVGITELGMSSSGLFGDLKAEEISGVVLGTDGDLPRLLVRQ